MKNTKKFFILITTILVTFTTRVHAEDFSFCAEEPVLKTFKIIGTIIGYLKILIPVILIILISIDLFKAFLDADEKQVTSATQTGIRRIIAAVIIFFVPTIVSVILSNVTGYKEGNYNSTETGTWKDCAICFSNPNDTKSSTTCDILIAKAKSNEEKEEQAYLTEEEQKLKKYQDQIKDQYDELIKQTKKIIKKSNKKKTNNQVAVPTGEWMWPLKDYGPEYITSGFGERVDPFTGAVSYHSGIDIGAPIGTDILAVDNGVVHFVRNEPEYDTGLYTVIYHGNDIYSEYMHQSEIYVTMGQNVKKGQVIGAVGTTGQSTGAHLHISKGIGETYWSNRVAPF